MTEVRHPEVLMERTRARANMNLLRGCHHPAIRLRAVLDLDRLVPKGYPSLETVPVEKNTPTLSPFLMGLGHPRRSRPHQNGTLSSTHLGSLGQRYLLPQGLRVRPRPPGAEWFPLDSTVEAERTFLISTLVVDGLKT